MSELRWIFLAAGLIVLALIFLLSRQDTTAFRSTLLARFARRPAAPRDRQNPATRVAPGLDQPLQPQQRASPERVVTVRFMARAGEGFHGEPLILALRDLGLKHGRFGIFHRYAADDHEDELFSVASLVEPGSFDLTRIKTQLFPGISLFLVLPGPADAVGAFDDMLMTARELAGKLDGELLDEQGNRLSVQRERYLREEVIQFQHRHGAA